MLRSGVTTLRSCAVLFVVALWSDVGVIIVGRDDYCAAVVGAPTLGACAGSDGTWVSGVGTFSARFSCVAMSNSAFCTRSPALKLGTVSAGGLVSIVMISSAACFK